MPVFKIRNYLTGEIIIQGEFPSLPDCLERAVQSNISLDDADLRHANLVNANLDNIVMRRARLDEANLMGANLSEAVLDGCDFTNAEMVGTCLCFSSVKQCKFTGARFGGTDIAGAILDEAAFSGHEAFSLNFHECQSIENCTYTSPVDKESYSFSKPPYVLRGMNYPLAVLDRHILVNHSGYLLSEIINPPAGTGDPTSLDEARLNIFIHNNRPLIRALSRHRGYIPGTSHSRRA